MNLYKVAIIFHAAEVTVRASSRKQAILKAEAWEIESERLLVDDWKIVGAKLLKKKKKR